MDYLGKVKTTS